MRKFRSYQFTASILSRLSVQQDVAAITVGRAQAGAVYVLPIASWREMVGRTYHAESIESAARVNTGTAAKGGMSDSVLVDILVNQVGEDGHIVGGTLYIVTLYGNDAAYLVPANAYWRGRVEGES